MDVPFATALGLKRADFKSDLELANAISAKIEADPNVKVTFDTSWDKPTQAEGEAQETFDSRVNSWVKKVVNGYYLALTKARNEEKVKASEEPKERKAEDPKPPASVSATPPSVQVQSVPNNNSTASSNAVSAASSTVAAGAVLSQSQSSLVAPTSASASSAAAGASAPAAGAQAATPASANKSNLFAGVVSSNKGVGTSSPTPSAPSGYQKVKKSKRTSKSSISSAAAFDPSSLTSSPRNEDLLKLTYLGGTDDIASDNDLEEIKELWLNLGLPADKVFQAAVDIAITCANTSSSDKAVIEGFSYDTNIDRRHLVSAIKSVTTLRKFCAFYAKVVWNIKIQNNQPPANWLKRGFKEEHKFAAFDFFYGVTSPASLDVKDGLVREPSEGEIIAFLTNKSNAINKVEQRANLKTSNSFEITGGRFGARKAPLQILDS